jgi:hypothetical protein
MTELTWKSINKTEIIQDRSRRKIGLDMAAIALKAILKKAQWSASWKVDNQWTEWTIDDMQVFWDASILCLVRGEGGGDTCVIEIPALIALLLSHIPERGYDGDRHTDDDCRALEIVRDRINQIKQTYAVYEYRE